MSMRKMANKEMLIDQLRRELPRLQADYAVRSFSLFGSFVRGEQTPHSDVDLLVEFNQNPGLLKFLALEEELTALLNHPVDLVSKDALKPAIGKRILAEIQPI